MTHHCAVISTMCHINCVNSFSQCTNLIDFNQHGIGNTSNKIALLLQNGQQFKPKGKYNSIGIITVDTKYYDSHKDGDVIEVIFKNGKFLPIRDRPDKVTSNHLKVILDNFKTSLSPPNMIRILC